MNNSTIDFQSFINDFKEKLHQVFYRRDDISKFSLKRGLPPLVMREIMSHNPLSVAIPEKFGGRGVKVKECLSVLEAASYESLPLSLTFGINIALFLEPVAKYAQEVVKSDIFTRFLDKQNMGGLMITEPNYGSDALNMQTSHYLADDKKYHIKGTKHWQGLTGLADYWLVTSRSKDEKGNLSRDIDFFIADSSVTEQHIEVQEYYNNVGLYMIPYGLNKIEISVPEQNKLQAESTGIKMMLDLLHRSRMQFPGMGMGFVRRMLDEGLQHTKDRLVGGKALFELDQVKYQLSRVQNAFTVCSAMCARSTEKSGIDNNLATDAVEANSIKTYITDLMQEASQTVAQLLGGNGYRLEHIAARGTIDSRPFQVFEGANEMLYTQISEMCLKMMKRAKELNFSKFLASYDLTENIADRVKTITDFSIETDLPQRKMVQLGRIISRLVSADMVIKLGEKGFRSDLVEESLTAIENEVRNLITPLSFAKQSSPIVEYNDSSSWLSFS